MQVDPAGKRTLGVITKCDMSTADTGLAGKLRAEEKQHVRLALGMVGVRNRTQAEVNDGITPEEVRRREAHFFESADVARGIPRRCWGMDTLTNRIVELQTETVKVWMQGIQASAPADAPRRDYSLCARSAARAPPPVNACGGCGVVFSSFHHDSERFLQEWLLRQPDHQRAPMILLPCWAAARQAPPDACGGGVFSCCVRSQARLRKEIVDAKKQLSALPDAVETPEAQRLLLSKGVLMVQSIFSAAAEARAGDLRDKTLNVSARADALYARYCAALVEATPNFMGVEMFERVQQELEETRGAALSNFLDKNVFKTIIMDTYRDAFKEAGSALIGDLRHYVQARAALSQQSSAEYQQSDRTTLSFVSENAPSLCFQPVVPVCALSPAAVRVDFRRSFSSCGAGVPGHPTPPRFVSEFSALTRHVELRAHRVPGQSG